MNTTVSFPKKSCLSKQVHSILLIALFILIQSYDAFAEGKLTPNDKQRLLAYINTYDSEKLISDSIVSPQIVHLLGQELNHLKNNINVHGPIGVNSGILFVSGNAPHKGGSEHGFVGINLYDGVVYAALLTAGKIKVYGKGNEYSQLPDGVKHWILMTWAYIKLDGKAPSNLEMLTNR